MNEKEKIELGTANSFLELYNELKTTKYVVVEVLDTPDVRCLDNSSHLSLDLEITLLEDRPGDIAYVFGRAKRKPELTIADTIDFKRDVLPRLMKSLEGKLLSSYGERTALVIRQVGPLWSVADWQRETQIIVAEAFKGRDKNYGMGVWILCRNTSAFPITDDLFALFDPSVVLKPFEDKLPQFDGIVAKVSWEDHPTEDFLDFTQQDNADPVIRIESPHGCGNAILIAFIKGEPEVWRQKAIDFYRAQMLFFCPCGQGNAKLLGNWI